MLPKIKKVLRFSIISTNIVALILYMLACLVPFINSGKSWFIAMLGLVFPLMFFVILGFLIYWLIRKSKWAFVCFAALLLSLQQLLVVFGFHFNKKFNDSKAPETLRVLTWNLSMWGESNTAHNGKFDYQDDMIDVIKKTNADVLCFQEYLYYKESKYRDSIVPSLKESGYRYSYFVKTYNNKRIYHTSILTAMVIISKYPIVDTAHFYFTEEDYSEPFIYADIKTNSNTVRIFSTRLESVRFENRDYTALRKLKEPGKESFFQTRAIAYKLRNAYKVRATEAHKIKQKIKESPFPAIVCGDFNDVPNSYTYFTIKDDLQDAFLKKGTGFGRTFRFISPTLRIDYILADKNFDVKQFTKIKVPFSDHYPIIADFNFPKK